MAGNPSVVLGWGVPSRDKKGNDMNTEQLEHLRKVIDYLYADEEKHYEQGGKPDGHIFESVKALSDMLEVTPTNDDGGPGSSEHGGLVINTRDPENILPSVVKQCLDGGMESPVWVMTSSVTGAFQLVLFTERGDDLERENLVTGGEDDAHQLPLMSMIWDQRQSAVHVFRLDEEGFFSLH